MAPAAVAATAITAPVSSTVAGVVAGAKSADKKLGKSAGKAASNVLQTKTAKRQATRAVRTAGDLFWRTVLVLLAISLLGLLLRAATDQPKRVDSLFMTLPTALQRFVNPFDTKATP